MKKFIALLLAFTMLFSVAVPAFAAADEFAAPAAGYGIIDTIVGFFTRIINFIKNIIDPPEQVAVYTITYVDTDGSLIRKESFAVGATVTAPPIPTKPGYVFMDWYPAIPETMPDRDITITARWAEI